MRPEQLPCSSALRAPLNRNVAIASPAMTGDPHLAAFFPQ
jgi:hypothetical protein